MLAVVDHARKQLLAGAAFGLDEDVGVGAGGGAGAGEGGFKRARAADDAAGGLRLWQCGGLARGHDFFGEGAQAIEGGGLGEVVDGAALHGFDRLGNRAVGGDEEEGRGVRGGLRGAEDFEAVAIGHAHVADDEVEGLAIDAAVGLADAAGGLDGPALAGEVGGERDADAGLVIGDEDRGAAGRLR